MNKLEEIQSCISGDIRKFQIYFKQVMRTDKKLLNIVLSYILKQKGKNLRPIIVFLISKLVGEISSRTYVAATLIELLHTATLVHDDVVDNSQLRRGNFSVKALWRSKLSVLVGDYMLAQGLKISVKDRAFDILEIVSDAVQDVSEGELLQLEHSRRLRITEEVYFEIIRKKTASLLVASAISGAVAGGATEYQKELITKFALNLGFAFQIKDDLFDYSSTKITGKPRGNDIQERKLTLPLIYSLNSCEKNISKKVMRIFHKKQKTRDDIMFVEKFVKKYGGIEYSEQKLETYRHKTKQILEEFADNEAKTALVKLIDFIIDRSK